MTKSEFKELWSLLRLGYHQCQEQMRGLYCGDDDAVYDAYEAWRERFLRDNPVLGRVVDNCDFYADELAVKANNGAFRWYRYKMGRFPRIKR